MSSIFTRIIQREIPGRLIWQDKHCVVAVDIRPLHEGHCLVIPIEEVDHWIDLPAEVAGHLMEVASHVGKAQSELFQSERVGLMIAGFEVPHAHVHVTPINSMASLDFANAKSSSDRQLDEVASRLRSQLRNAGHADWVVES